MPYPRKFYAHFAARQPNNSARNVQKKRHTIDESFFVAKAQQISVVGAAFG